ncbi:MAG: hypothetical protein ACK4UL_10080 [Novosphingobium meiothermophilum]|uniref:hypothetical protein n=1 Tax=Novosphingobium TaxID=165696 RepID=UPI000D6DD094|nr:MULTISPECIES: hypothetical protein [Novosphingobium]
MGNAIRIDAATGEIERITVDAQAAVPEAISMRQARLALLRAGLLEVVDAAIAAQSGVEGEAARIEWEYAADVRRDSSLVQMLAPVIGLSAEQVDALFVMGAGL